MKGRYPLAPMIAPGILGGVTAVDVVSPVPHRLL
mgnify:CR=1 FL=1